MFYHTLQCRRGCKPARGSLTPEFRNQIPAGNGRPLRAAVVHVSGPQMIQAQQIENGRVNVPHVMRLLHRAQADFIGASRWSGRL